MVGSFAQWRFREQVPGHPDTSIWNLDSGPTTARHTRVYVMDPSFSLDPVVQSTLSLQSFEVHHISCRVNVGVTIDYTGEIRCQRLCGSVFREAHCTIQG